MLIRIRKLIFIKKIKNKELYTFKLKSCLHKPLNYKIIIMSASEVESVKNFLKSKHMYAKHNWLEDCVKYIILNQMSKDLKTIIEITAQQWLLSDLKNVSCGCLPPNLKTKSKVVLNEKYMLQINSEIDIGVSAYQQYCKVTNVNDENVEATLSAEDKISSHRMLKLSMTDGVQDILGIEYKSINKIKRSLIPGSKVLIKGPVMCRSGVLFLENSSIEIMGGEVKEISNDNVKTAILATKLGLQHVPVHPTSNNQYKHSENTESNEKLGSHEPPGKRQRTFCSDPPRELELNASTEKIKIVSSNPFIYIKQINDMSETAKMGKTCRVKAQILHMLKKPFYSKDSWIVECKITDGTGCLDVQIESDWFSKLVLYSPQEMADLNKKRLSHPAEIPVINRDLIKKLGRAMETLKSLYCIMELILLPTPVIRKFIPFDNEHVILLNERLQSL